MGQNSTSHDIRHSYVNADIEQRTLVKFHQTFCLCGTLQGRISYLLMSIHAVNPNIVKYFTDYDPKNYLFTNMLYGTCIMLYTRPSMKAISTFNRVVFSVLGSLMFNHSTMLLYEWIAEKLSHRIYVKTFVGLLAGRILMLHLLAYLYHVDSRNRSFHIRPYADYETMYRQL